MYGLREYAIEKGFYKDFLEFQRKRKAENRKVYHAKWNKENYDKVRENIDRYRINNRDKVNERAAKYREKNRDKIRQYNKERNERLKASDLF